MRYDLAMPPTKPLHVHPLQQPDPPFDEGPTMNAPRKLFLVMCLAALRAHAADTVPLQSATTQLGRAAVAATAPTSAQQVDTAAQQHERVMASVWGLSLDELRRANALMAGHRNSFSSPNLSPLEVLGIHARNEAERRKYAEMLARVMHDDVERILAFGVAYQEAMARLYPNDPVVDFATSGPKPVVAPAAAQANHLPGTAYKPAPQHPGR